MTPRQKPASLPSVTLPTRLQHPLWPGFPLQDPMSSTCACPSMPKAIRIPWLELELRLLKLTA